MGTIYPIDLKFTVYVKLYSKGLNINFLSLLIIISNSINMIHFANIVP